MKEYQRRSLSEYSMSQMEYLFCFFQYYASAARDIIQAIHIHQ